MATKKISELPLINKVSGSQVNGGSVLPIVVGGGLQGTTNQISVEDFSIFVNAYNAHTGSAGNVFTGPQTINNNVTINGRLTVVEVVAQYETASILFSTGSTKLGDQLTDKHEFTGSTNITGSLTANGFITLNGQSLNNAFDRIHQTTHSLQLATASLQFHSASVDAQLLAIQQTTQSLHVATASLQFHSASVNAQLQRLQQTTQSLQVATASLQAFSSSVNEQLERVYQTTQSLHVATASLEFHSASVDAQLLAIQQTTQSLHVATASLQFHSASVDAQLLAIQQTTQSLQIATASINSFTSSQLAVNLGNSIYTASVDSHIVGISTYTSSVRDTLARVHQATQSLQVATASLQQFTASQDSRNFVVSQVTGSLIGITNGLMAFTAALDNTYATDAQLYQLYQSTQSLELHSGSMVGVTNGLMAYTASNTSLNTGLRGEVDGIEAYTASLKGQAIVSSSTQVQNYDVFALNSNLYTSTGSLIGITNGLMAFTAALDSTYATDAQLFQLYQATRSIELTTGSLIGITNGLMAFSSSQLAVNLTLSTVTGSLIGITNGLMAFTAALDNTYATDAQLYQLYQATQSLELTTGSLIGITNGLMAFTAALDSTYATDAQLYQLYAETASIKAEIGGIEAYTASLKGAAIVSSSQQITNYYKFAETASANTVFYGNVTASGNLHANQLYIGGATTASGLFGASEAVVQNELGIQFGDATGTYMRLIANAANSNTAIVAGAFSGAQPPLDLIAGGITAISVKNDGGVNFGGALTASIYKVNNGGGIDFSATSNGSGTTSSELLNDYEEGTFTPVLKGSTTDGTYTYDTDRTLGKYVKIGKQVFLEGVLRVLTVTSAGSGNALLSGIPFAPAVIATNWDRVPGVLHVQSGPTLPSASLFCYTQANTYSDSIGFGYDGMEGWNQLPVTTVDEVNAMWFFTITYIVS